MNLEKISNAIKTKLQSTSESIKKVAQVSVVTVWILAWSGCSEIKEEIKKDLHASVEKIPYTKKSPFSLINIIDSKWTSKCNIFRFKIQDKIYSWSAKHCFQDTGWKKLENDIIILPNLKANQRMIVNNSKQQPIKAIEITNKYAAPTILNVSSLSHQEIENETVIIQGTFPDDSWHASYKISGKPIYDKNTEVFMLIINNNDFEKIMSQNSISTRQWLQGMSGSPVLDSKWELIGVHIAGYNWKNKNSIKGLWDLILHHWLDSWNVLIFNPIRDKNGKIKNHTLPSSKIQEKNPNKKQVEKRYKVDINDKTLLQKYDLDAQYYIKSREGRIYFGTDTLTGEKKSIHLKFKRKEQEIEESISKHFNDKFNNYAKQYF